MRIFISHASGDKPLARAIGEALRRRGIDVWIDEAEIRVGQSISGEIQRALQSSDVLCILLSSSATNSKWVNRELNAFLPLFIDGSHALVPCRVDRSPIPVLIRDIKYADFTGEFESGVNELLNAVAIREEVLERTRLETMRDHAIGQLAPEALSFFWNLSEKDTLEFFDDDFDVKANSLLSPQLDALVRLGLVTEY